MSIKLNIGSVGQSRRTQDPESAFKAAEGKYKDEACDLSDDQKYTKVNAAPDKRPFSVRGSAG